MSTPHPQAYGIHLLKTAGIACQTIMHSVGWAAGIWLIPMAPIRFPWTEAHQVLTGIALIIAMTAGGILRMTSAMAPDGKRLGPINWPQTLLTLFLLAISESIKQVLIGQSFWCWNALHSIAVGLAITMFIAQRSLVLLWSAAFLIIFITPYLATTLGPLEPPWTFIHPHLPFALAATGVWTVFMGLLYNAASHKYASLKKRKVLFIVLWLIGCLAASQAQGITGEYSILLSLPLGALVGTVQNAHIWPVFPWISLIMFGFLIVDVVERHNSSSHVLITLGFIGAALMAVFFSFMNAEVAYDTFGMRLFTASFFNRAPGVITLTIGTFCLLLPLAYYMAKAGWQTPYVVTISRSVLWLYMYQTVVLIWLAQGMHALWPDLTAVPFYLILAVATTMALPYLLSRIPLQFRFSLRKIGRR